MLSRVRIAIRFFFVGLAVGVLLAPRTGVETRRMVRERIDRLFNDVLDAATFAVPTPARTDGAPVKAASSAAGKKDSAIESGEPSLSGREA
jgi:gas vesicle protein